MKKRTRLSTVARGCLLVVGLMAAVIVTNAFTSVSKQIDVPEAPRIEIDRQGVIERFQQAIRMKTISHENPARTDTAEFDRFGEYLRQTYPELYQEPLEHWTGQAIGDPENQSLLYRWPGSDAELEPVLLMAHYDVVPVEIGSESRWNHAPFAANVQDDFVWGRGTLDAKNSAISIIEAVVRLRREGFLPKRTIYLSLGHDEEVGGMRGNRRIAQWMKSNGVRLQFVLDEGGCIFTDFPAADRPVALIGIAEKGYANLRLTASVAEGGHASMPPPETAIEILSRAIAKLNRTPLPRRADGATELMLDYLGPEMAWPNRIALANRWLFRPLIVRQLGNRSSGNAMLRTTMATTMIEGGVQENVLPSQAAATLNVRLLPGDSISSVVEFVEAKINDDRVSVELLSPNREASRVSSTESESFNQLHRCIKEIYPDVLVAPFVLVGGTDSSHFQDIARDIYRFIPARLSDDDLKRIHGVDERIAEADYLDLIRFYVRLIKTSTG